MQKQKQFFIIFLVLLSFTAKAQNPIFEKTVDSINAIIKANPLTYYMPEHQYSAFVKKISVTQEGVVSFKDSILEEVKTTNMGKVQLISDCCSQKKPRTLNLLSIKKWEIHFPNAYLKNEKGEEIGRIIGLKKAAMNQLKEQFDVLQSLCLDYVNKKEEAKAKAIADKYRCDLPDPKKNTAAQAAMKKAEELNKNKK